jgi:hypothetical protein
VQDTSPPLLRLLGEMPATATAADIANFTFAANDSSAVTLSCRLQGGHAPQGNLTALQELGPNLNNPVELGVWGECYSPYTLYWLLPGESTHMG